MTDILLNSNAIKNEYNSNATINEIIDHVLDTHVGKTDILTNLTVDGIIVPQNLEAQYLEHTIGQHQTIDIEVKTNIELAYEALDSCSSYIDNIVEKINLLVELYSENKILEANQHFAEAIDIIDLFIQLLSKITSTFRRSLGPKFTTSQTIQNLEIHLLSVMKALLPAKEKNDVIMLCDLLEYELIDNLTQWKIKAIPELRKTKDL